MFNNQLLMFGLAVLLICLLIKNSNNCEGFLSCNTTHGCREGKQCDHCKEYNSNTPVCIKGTCNSKQYAALEKLYARYPSLPPSFLLQLNNHKS